ncbi:ABC transporter related protein [Desulfovibrio sp. X2]|uniref:energy-coupling factor ABC transporter ATP-binding protein n=1 Tax=Desulfovibrio sp. X2 TaxID=941449 RepID=UPI000358EE04|nr:ABC transporter ATP-binding protein [Desulfovibrio sp. X2]EPR37349.1 ABC transporter related protein [Desulfovibrio sp. X2]
MSDVLLELRDVVFTYPGSSAPTLDGLDFSFCADQRIGLVGHNGSGKTTLLHIMMGLLRPQRGAVIFAGRPVATEKEFRQVRTTIGLLLQNADDQLFFPTVLDDVAFGPLNLGQTPAQARETALAVLASLGLAGFENRLTHKLSGGEKKLVSLAAVLAMNPRALLLDEPTNSLDPATRDRLVDILCDLDRPCVIISHDWDFLARVTREFRTISGGKLIDGSGMVPHHHVHVHPLGFVEHEHDAVHGTVHAAGHDRGHGHEHEHDHGHEHCHDHADHAHDHVAARDD